MPINLQDIRTAVVTYVDTKVTVSISPLTPAGGGEIDPEEEFRFTLTARNADSASGGVNLKDVVWRVWVLNDAVGKLIVPPGPMLARSALSIASPPLAPGSQVREMYLFPASDGAGNYLAVGDTDTVNLRGKAGPSPAGGSTSMNFKIYADVDLDWLLPKDQDSSTATRTLTVSG